MSILATARPIRELENGQYRCRRCGIERWYSVSRARPVLCRDCTEVEAAMSDEPMSWNEGEAMKARSAYVQGDRSEWACEGQLWYDRRRRQRNAAQKRLRAAGRVSL